MYATIIIDDPLLRESYGFLNYKRLLDLMDKHNFHTAIAFIPWNYDRTDKRISTLFKLRPDRFSLCIHGCDHTAGEFGSTDINYLDKKIKLATARMMEHEKRTGIPFDRIMVFPQGKFSNEALQCLKQNNYWAAVNTEQIPVGGKITASFPIFFRYRPEDLIAQDTNPILIVLHHDFFKHGYQKLEKMVDDLNSRYGNIKWDSLGNIIRQYVPNKKEDHLQPDVDVRGFKNYGYKESIKITMRRYASELRDNYICRNEFVLNFALKMKNLIQRNSI